MQSREVGCSSRMPGSAERKISRQRAISWASSRRTGPSTTPASRLLAGHPEQPQRLLRQVDPAAAQVLADVAQEVRELERDAEVARVRGGGA